MQYKLTKVITVTPRFLIRNKLPYKINVREHRSRDFVSVEPGQRQGFVKFRPGGGVKLLTVAVAGLNAEWFVTHLVYDHTS